MRINKLLVGAGIIGIAATGVVTAIATYNAHDKIKEVIESDDKTINKVKSIALTYAPSAAITVGTAGMFIASEVLGERKANELRMNLDKAKKGYDKVSTWYKDQSDAIKKQPEKTQKEIEAEIIKREKERIHEADEADFEDQVMMYDPITKCSFKASRSDVTHAMNTINKQLVTDSYAMYEDFYTYLGQDIPGDWQDFGWSIYTASAMWVNPWVDLEFTIEGDKTCIYFVSDQGCGHYVPFEPEEDPTSDDWK